LISARIRSKQSSASLRTRSLAFWTYDALNIMALATGGLTSIIAYRFVIQGMSPKVGYFLLSDHIFTFFVSLAFFKFCTCAYMDTTGYYDINDG
jgi:hypothetical protein